jgi:hypothetical protein
MPKASKQTASSIEQAPGYEGRFEDLGGYTVAFESYSDDADLAPLFTGLPDDRCQCPHWGVVLTGKVTYHYSDRAETIEAGEAYFDRPGTPRSCTRAPRSSSSARPLSSSARSRS